MKKVLLMATAVAMIFTACTKENNGNQEPTNLNVLLKIPNVKPATRAIGAPGVSPAIIPLTDGKVFIISSSGTILSSVTLDVNAATGGGGQTISGVPSDAKIFVLGNVPADVTTTPTTLDKLLAMASEITTQSDYTTPALGNVNGEAVAVTVTSTTKGEVDVEIRPLYARIELAQVVGGDNEAGDKVAAFKVTGVWVDSWHPKFTMGGMFAGDIYNQLTNTNFDDNSMGDTDEWVAVGDLGNMIAAPEAGKSWIYHVPAGDLPRLIVRVENIEYELIDAIGTTTDATIDPYFITVKGYKVGSDNLLKFQAGYIYQIGGTAGITFDKGTVHPIPNPDDFELTLTVKIIDWEIVQPGAELY